MAGAKIVQLVEDSGAVGDDGLKQSIASNFVVEALSRSR